MMTLLCVEPGEVYVDEDMDTWRPINLVYEEVCQYCGCGMDGTDGFKSRDHDGFIHGTCVTEVLPCQMFPAYAEHRSMPEIMERFITVFQAAEREFTKHMPEKGDSWLQLPTSNLFTTVHKVSAKLMLAETIGASYNELVDLLLCSAMLAQRYLIDQAQEDAEENGESIPF